MLFYQGWKGVKMTLCVRYQALACCRPHTPNGTQRRCWEMCLAIVIEGGGCHWDGCYSMLKGGMGMPTRLMDTFLGSAIQQPPLPGGSAPVTAALLLLDCHSWGRAVSRALKWPFPSSLGPGGAAPLGRREMTCLRSSCMQITGIQC